MVKVEITEKRLVARPYDWKRSPFPTPEKEVDSTCAYGLDSRVDSAEIHYVNGNLSVVTMRHQEVEFETNDLWSALRQVCSLFNPFTAEYTIKLTRVK